MAGVRFDWEINLTGILTAVGVIIAIGRALLSVRDEMRGLSQQIGSVDDSRFQRSGIIGELARMREDIAKLQATATDHREWLIANGFDRRKTPRAPKERNPP